MIMPKNNLTNCQLFFNDIRQIDGDGNEYWQARELQLRLNISWTKFNLLIKEIINDKGEEVSFDIKSIREKPHPKKSSRVDYILSRQGIDLILNSINHLKSTKNVNISQNNT